MWFIQGNVWSLFADNTEEIPNVCVVKVESINQQGQDQAAQHHHSSPPPTNDVSTGQVIVKTEKPEEERDDSACCLDSVKVEEFRLECMSAVQSTILEEWNSEVQDISQQYPNNQSSCSRLDKGKTRL